MAAANTRYLDLSEATSSPCKFDATLGAMLIPISYEFRIGLQIAALIAGAIH
jgi:hypothetical protein